MDTCGKRADPATGGLAEAARMPENRRLIAGVVAGTLAFIFNTVVVARCGTPELWHAASGAADLLVGVLLLTARPNISVLNRAAQRWAKFWRWFLFATCVVWLVLKVGAGLLVWFYGVTSPAPPSRYAYAGPACSASGSAILTPIARLEPHIDGAA